jgi:hypothetical protein
MATNKITVLSSKETTEILAVLQERFRKNMQRHEGMQWSKIEEKLQSDAHKLWILNAMEESGGEPDVIEYNSKDDAYTFVDCSPESPSGRRSLCYDEQALNDRKENKPAGSAKGIAADLGIDILTEEEYRHLQTLGKFDAKTSSWLETPEKIRKLGGAIFGDLRYDTVFMYHNGAQSYYAARGFRGKLIV